MSYGSYEARTNESARLRSLYPEEFAMTDRCYDCCHEDCTGDAGERPHCGCPRMVMVPRSAVADSRVMREDPTPAPAEAVATADILAALAAQREPK